ncbi:hypothetical protein ACFTQ7_18100 [Lysinibacillus sp. NPDC056959]|uniref:hypothetical protein n=1 Tax=Lysinibacillus sp. NPDC056959 TaxID=3345981 RepID=UPI003639E233
MDELILSTMESYNQYIDVVFTETEKIVKSLRDGNIQVAIKNILDFSEGVDWMAQVNEKLAILGYENSLYIKKIHEFLEEINSGLEIQDFLLVADIFEYEIKPFFERVKPYEIPAN